MARKQAKAEPAPAAIRGSRTYWILGALVLGIVVGALLRSSPEGFREPMLQVANVVGRIGSMR